METKDILKQLRKSRGYSNAKDFCDASGISYNTYQNYEAGKRVPTADILITLADFYGVTTDCLLGRESQKNYFANENVPMSPDEFNDKFEQLPDNIKKSVLDVLIYLTETAEERGQKPNIEHTSKAIARTSDGSSELREPPTDEQMASFEEVTEDNF